MEQKNTYFIYARKSSEGEDRQMLSLDGQLNDLKKIITQNNLSIIDTYTESKSAHAPDNRPRFNEMIARIMKGQANGIICWHINRLSRNPKESGEIQQLLQDGKIISIITPYRLYKSEDNALLFSIESSEANQYSRDLSRNVKRGLQQKIEMGQPPWLAPLGYLNTKSSVLGSNSIVIDPVRFPIIRKGYDLLLSGAYTVPQITNILNTEYGLRTRPGKVLGNKPISKSTMYRIFIDPFYYGYFLKQGTLYKGQYPPLISVKEYDLVQTILGRKGKPRPIRHFFPFTGLMKCGECGGSITATKKLKWVKSTAEIKAYSFYHCTKRKVGTKCTSDYITEKDMEQLIIDELGKYELKPLFKNLAVEFINENQRNDSDRSNELIKAQVHIESKLQTELNTLLEMRISGEIDSNLYTEKKQEKEDTLRRIRDHIHELEQGKMTGFIKVLDLLNYSTNLVERFKNADINEKKEICHRFGSHWIVSDKKLFIDKLELLNPIKMYKESIGSIFGTSEPEITYENKGQNQSFELIRPALSGLIKDVRTTTYALAYKEDIRQTNRPA